LKEKKTTSGTHRGNRLKRIPKISITPFVGDAEKLGLERALKTQAFRFAQVLNVKDRESSGMSPPVVASATSGSKKS